MNTHLTYLMILAASLAGPLLLSFDKKVAFYKHWKDLCRTSRANPTAKITRSGNFNAMITCGDNSGTPDMGYMALFAH